MAFEHSHVQWRHRRLASVCECGFPEGTSGGEAPHRHAAEVPANLGAGYEEHTQVHPMVWGAKQRRATHTPLRQARLAVLLARRARGRSQEAGQTRLKVAAYMREEVLALRAVLPTEEAHANSARDARARRCNAEQCSTLSRRGQVDGVSTVHAEGSKQRESCAGRFPGAQR